MNQFGQNLRRDVYHSQMKLYKLSKTTWLLEVQRLILSSSRASEQNVVINKQREDDLHCINKQREDYSHCINNQRDDNFISNSIAMLWTKYYLIKRF